NECLMRGGAGGSRLNGLVLSALNWHNPDPARGPWQGGAQGMAGPIRWTLIAGIVLIVGVAPFVYFRDLYAYNKRLKEVVPDRFYRAGQMTADGLAETVQKLHIKLVLNVQDDFPDPDLFESFWSNCTVKESDLCRRLGVR